MEMALQAIGMAVKDLDPDRRELLEIARRGASRMRQLIEDLLSYAMVGKGLGDPEPVDLADVLHQVVVDLAEQTDGASTNVLIGELPTVSGHRSLLVQLFQNLVSNAIKFARPDVAPRIEVASEPTATGWLVTVTDNGIGIEASKRNEVFGMFTRLGGDDAYPGTGIGLATCQKAVLQHGGRLWAEDGIDGGSRFCVTLPR
jgi:signal transduction histidine kinase